MITSIKFRLMILMVAAGAFVFSTAAVVEASPCIVPDNGSGTATLPPMGCDYTSPDEVFMIIDGLPPGTTIEMEGILMDFICCGNTCALCSMPLGPGECEMPGGSLGGDGHCFEATLDLTVTGTGELEGFTRHLAVPITCEVHTGPRNPGDPVQTFPCDMYRWFGELFGDPDFCTFRITAGTDFGLPGPGVTTLTQLPGGDFAVDSFFDITYQIEFDGCPGSPLADYAGITTATIRIRAGEPFEECGPKADGTGCKPVYCPDPNDECQPICVNFDPNTNQVIVLDCECRGPNECHVDIPEPTWPCNAPDNGSGTVTLPPIGCDYTSPDEVFMIIDGLPPGTTIEMEDILMDFICCGNTCAMCSMPLGPGECETAGGSLGGHGHCFEATLDLTVSGTGSLEGFNRHLAVPVFCEVHTGSRNPGDPVQTFPTVMYRWFGELFGDPDFCEFRITAGTDYGLPSPGQTILTKLPSGDFAVDSFFDITYQIEFEGCPASPLDGYMGTTTATIRIETGSGSLPQPRCVGGDCLCWEFCYQTTNVNPDGSIDICCDCVPDADLNRDGIVNFKDFAIMGMQWLSTRPSP